MTHSALCRHTCRPSVGGKRGRMDNYPSHVIGHYSTLHLTRWKDLCCGKFKTVHLGYRLIELLHRGCGQWEMRFFAGTDEHYGVWRGSITEIGSNRGEALSAGSQLSGQSMPIQSNCFNNRDGISRCFPRFEMWIVSFLFFFSIFLLFLFFVRSFVCLFVCLSLAFFSFFIDENFHFTFREECLDLFLMPVALYINWILRSRIKKEAWIRSWNISILRNKK